MPNDKEHISDQSPKQRLINWIQSLVALLIIVSFASYIWHHRSLFAGVLDISAVDVLLIAVFIVATWVIIGAQIYVIFRALGLQIGFWESCVLSVASAFGNYLPLRAGTIIRAHYMKTVHQLSYAKFGSVFSIRLLLTLIVSGLVGLISTIAVAQSSGRLSIELLLLFFVCIFLPCLTYFWSPGNTYKLGGRIGRIWHDFSDGFHQLKTQPKVGLISFQLILLQYIALGARFYIAFCAMGLESTIALISLLVALTAVSSFVALTPGGLGVREAVMGYATFAAGISFSQGVFVGTIDRGILLLMITFFGGAGFLWIWSKIRNREVDDSHCDKL